MKQKNEQIHTTRLLTYLLIGLIGVLGCSRSRRYDDTDSRLDGSDPVFGGFSRNRDLVDLLDEQGYYLEVPKSIPICDMKYSELIPCLDRNLIYQLKLKPNLTVMEHYERHWSPTRATLQLLNSTAKRLQVKIFIVQLVLIPTKLLLEFQIPIRWPVSRDEVWKANIPHTHLAEEKSDQHWMVVDGEKIKFPGGGTHFHYGADKYIVGLAQKFILLSLMLSCYLYIDAKISGDKLNNGGHIRMFLMWDAELQGYPSTLGVLGTKGFLIQADHLMMTPDASWNVSMKACITPYSARMHKERWSGLLPWPQRLTGAPPRLEELVLALRNSMKILSAMIFDLDLLVGFPYKSLSFDKNSIRNVMDMNSNLGGFATALKDKDVWVMNVASVKMSARLKIIYDRGLIGTVHDWCEAFSTYPRTYDLLHAWAVFSEIKERGCSPEDLLIEMDRILRPDGDKYSVINYIQKFITALRWDGWLSEVEPRTDALTAGEERDQSSRVIGITLNVQTIDGYNACWLLQTAAIHEEKKERSSALDICFALNGMYLLKGPKITFV
ncbi:hypothetical protein CXB51_003799 [Gossypium anomalum]|uniref:Methyltransferase n=1 Tax=Gossypium anomalum TaxID=47600 RepID=A0A8J6A0Z2_9ROSI|nr:hypothetical protein CXB51_003799 [Gossypium anomalum]